MSRGGPPDIRRCAVCSWRQEGAELPSGMGVVGGGAGAAFFSLFWRQAVIDSG